MDETTYNSSDPDRTLPMTKPGGPPPPSTILPREISGRFKIRRAIGSGTFGIVYLAEDLKIGRLVAIKQLFPRNADDSTIQQRFLLEAKIAGQLEHPNIIIVYNIEGDEQSTAIIMEYLGGGNLEDLLKKENTLNPKIAINIMLGILNGLSAAHHIMVVHRDIKPQNIIFAIGAAPKITDFGVAHLPPSAGGVEELFEEERGSIIGTPLYMSPEQVLMKDVDSRTDLYSAGVILYRMLSGHTLFPYKKNAEMEEVRDLILHTKPESIRKFRKDVPKEIDDVLFRMLDKKPENRYPNASEVARDLIKVSAKLKSKTPDGKVPAPMIGELLYSPASILEDIISLLLVDGVITPPERTELEKRTEKLGLSEIQSRAIEEKIREEKDLPRLEDLEKLRAMAEHFFELSRGQCLDEDQLRQLKVLQCQFRVSKEELKSICMQCAEKFSKK